MTLDAEPSLVQVGDQPRPKKRELPRGEVHVFDNWCKGCGLCIEFCPAGVLVLGMDNRPKPVYPEKCTACRWCELHCPDFAIFVTDIDGEAAVGDQAQVPMDEVAEQSVDAR